METFHLWHLPPTVLPSCALVWSLYVPCSNEAGDRPRSLWFVMRPGPEKGQACSASFPPWGFLTQNKQKVCFLVLRDSSRHLVLHREQNINHSALSLIFSPPLLRQCRTLGSALVEFSYCLTEKNFWQISFKQLLIMQECFATTCQELILAGMDTLEMLWKICGGYAQWLVTEYFNKMLIKPHFRGNSENYRPCLDCEAATVS